MDERWRDEFGGRRRNAGAGGGCSHVEVVHASMPPYIVADSRLAPTLSDCNGRAFVAHCGAA